MDHVTELAKQIKHLESDAHYQVAVSYWNTQGWAWDYENLKALIKKAREANKEAKQQAPSFM